MFSAVDAAFMAQAIQLAGLGRYTTSPNPNVGAVLVKNGQVITELSLDRAMALAHVPDPELLIRTGGELRISNFLLWQSAYTELVFTDCLWPDFDEAELDRALREFARRERRFGQTSEQRTQAEPEMADVGQRHA